MRIGTRAQNMAHRLADHSGRPFRRQRGEEAGVRDIVLVLAFLLVGAAFSAVWLYHSAHRGPAATGEPSGSQPTLLSDATLTVLQKLDSVLEIRFYSVLDPASVPDSVMAFASRVDQLLSAYQQAAGGKINLTRFDSQSKLNPNAARADGVQAFNLDKGEACYLGVALAFKGRKETLPYLSPEWEQAVEPDLTRAIIRLVEAPRPVAAAALAPLEVNTNAVQEVKALIPNLGTVSVEEGTRILREAALKDFTAAAKEMETQVKEAEQRVTQAQNGGSEADQQAARKHLQQVQTEQTEKLKQIAARSQAQIDALQQLKASPH
jgi:ABC-type uncharacterized transport system